MENPMSCIMGTSITCKTLYVFNISTMDFTLVIYHISLIVGVLQSFPHNNIAKYKNEFTKCIKLT